MLTISRPIIVEGKYDKIKVASVAHAVIVQTDGFGIFKNDERAALIRRLAEKNGVIVLTDSDAAGMTIRHYIKNILPADKIINLYTPGKNSAEKRKALLRELSLPQTLSANAMLEAVSLTVSPEKWEETISKISAKEWQKDEVSE